MVEIESFKKEKDFIIKIKDNGRGMTNEQVKQIDAYIQFDRDQYEQQGMGLGLTISQKLTEMYGGKFTIKSKYGNYTEITMLFPLDEQNQNLIT